MLKDKKLLVDPWYAQQIILLLWNIILWAQKFWGHSLKEIWEEHFLKAHLPSPYLLWLQFLHSTVHVFILATLDPFTLQCLRV